MRTNLRPNFFNNYYYRVIKPFSVYIRIGIADSNTYVGRSQMLGNVYRHIELAVGDEIHSLAGGTFAVTSHGANEAKMQLSDKHPFEKVYSEGEEIWPMDHLEETSNPKNPKYNTQPAHMKPGKLVGRGIDSVVE